MKSLRRTVVALAAICASGTVLFGISPASAINEDEPLIVEVGEDVTYSDADGNSLTVRESSDSTAESVYEGVTRGGTPVRIFVQRAPEGYLHSPELPVHENDGELPDYHQGDVDVLVHDETDGTPISETDTTFVPSFAYGVTPTTITLAWAPVPNATKYTITVNGQTTNVGDERTFAIDDLSKDTEYNFEVSSFGDDGDGNPVVLNSRNTLVKTIGYSERSMQPYTYQAGSTALIYKTFIRDSRVDLGPIAALGCLVFNDSTQFGGDDRSWRVPSYKTPWEDPDYRTMMFVNVNWNNAADSFFYLAKDVGATTRYVDGKLESTRTANPDGMSFSNASGDTSYAQVRLNHEVGNPYCLGGAITYHATARFYRSGTIEIAGSRFPVPNHEVYGRWDNLPFVDQWRTLGRMSNEGFNCLVGACGTKAFSEQSSY